MRVSVHQAIELLNRAQVVGLPTETVYGLAGKIDSSKALEQIFAVKKRPFFDPLIVHVADIKMAQSLALQFSKIAEVLAHKFWPGPLTLVLPKNEKVSDLITSGLSSVGLRMPNHPVALEIIQSCGPLAAPSANLFGRLSPTTADHVEAEFNQQVAVVDGGSCAVGIESTVLKMDDQVLSFLRRGAISQDEIERTLKEAGLDFTVNTRPEKKYSPGEMKHHYLPQKPLIFIRATQKPNWQLAVQEILDQQLDPSAEVTVAIPAKDLLVKKGIELHLGDRPDVAARSLYGQLRQLDQSENDYFFYFQRQTEANSHSLWLAIEERIYKASVLRV